MENLTAIFSGLTASQLKAIWEDDKRKAGVIYPYEPGFYDLREGGSQVEGEAQQIMFLIGAVADNGFACLLSVR